MSNFTDKRKLPTPPKNHPSNQHPSWSSTDPSAHAFISLQAQQQQPSSSSSSSMQVQHHNSHDGSNYSTYPAAHQNQVHGYASSAMRGGQEYAYHHPSSPTSQHYPHNQSHQQVGGYPANSPFTPFPATSAPISSSSATPPTSSSSLYHPSHLTHHRVPLAQSPPLAHAHAHAHARHPSLVYAQSETRPASAIGCGNNQFSPPPRSNGATTSMGHHPRPSLPTQYGSPTSPHMAHAQSPLARQARSQSISITTTPYSPSSNNSTYQPPTAYPSPSSYAQAPPVSPTSGPSSPTSPSKTHVCDLCGFAFNRAYDLRRHKDTHTDNKPHLCTTCGKSYTRKDALKRHILVRKCGMGGTADPNGEDSE